MPALGVGPDWHHSYPLSFLHDPSLTLEELFPLSSLSNSPRLSSTSRRSRGIEGDTRAAVEHDHAPRQASEGAAMAKRVKVQPSRLPPSTKARKSALDSTNGVGGRGIGQVSHEVLDLTRSDDGSAESSEKVDAYGRSSRSALPSSVEHNSAVNSSACPASGCAEDAPAFRLFPKKRIPLPPQQAIVPSFRPCSLADTPTPPLPSRPPPANPVWPLLSPGEAIVDCPPPTLDLANVYLSDNALFPSLRGLTFESYKPFLLDEPIEPSFAASYWESYARFLGVSTAYELWSPSWKRLLHRQDTPPLVRLISTYQPAKEAIRTSVRLRSSTSAFPPDLEAKCQAMAVVMRWIWEDATIGEREVAWLVENAPRPLHILGAFRPLLLSFDSRLTCCFSQSTRSRRYIALR